MIYFFPLGMFLSLFGVVATVTALIPGLNSGAYGDTVSLAIGLFVLALGVGPVIVAAIKPPNRNLLECDYCGLKWDCRNPPRDEPEQGSVDELDLYATRAYYDAQSRRATEQGASKAE